MIESKTRLRNLLMMIDDVTKCLSAHCVKTTVVSECAFDGYSEATQKIEMLAT